MLQTFREPPVEEQHVNLQTRRRQNQNTRKQVMKENKTRLEDQVYQEGYYEYDKDRMPPGAAHRVGHRRL